MAGQVDYFLKVTGVEGESKDDTHPDEIQIESWSFGATQPGTFGTGGGGGAAKVQAGDFHFTMKVSKASPKLFLHVHNGEHFNQAIITARKAGKTPLEYYKWTFTDCMVTSFQTGGSSSDVTPLEQISLNFGKAEVEYTEQNTDGSGKGKVKAGYDYVKNKVV
jgi:type VI secretion system secreted protein Hcp